MLCFIVLTNGSAGKILEVSQGKNIKLLQEFAHPQTQKKIVDEATKAKGTLSHAIDYSGEIEKRERNIFAKEINDYLTKALTTQKIDLLIFVAPPTMLGELRHESIRHSRQTSVYELHKDLLSQRLSHEEILDRIREDLDIKI